MAAQQNSAVTWSASKRSSEMSSLGRPTPDLTILTPTLTSGWLLFFLCVQSKCSEAARTLRDKNTDVTSVCSYVIYWRNLISWLDVCCNEKTYWWLIQIFVLFSSFISDCSKSGTTSKYDKFTLLPLLTDNVQKNVEVRKQLSFGRMGHVLSTTKHSKLSRNHRDVGKGIPQDWRTSWRREKGLTNLEVIERILVIHSRWAGF